MSGWSLFGLLIGLELTGLDLKTADAAYPRFYRAVADFVYHGRLGLRSRNAWRGKLLPLTAADLRQDLYQSHATASEPSCATQYRVARSRTRKLAKSRLLVFGAQR
jgi:hypothetical protein